MHGLTACQAISKDHDGYKDKSIKGQMSQLLSPEWVNENTALTLEIGRCGGAFTNKSLLIFIHILHGY